YKPAQHSKAGDRPIETRGALDFAAVAGGVLRQLRANRDLSLRDVHTRSRGVFKPSTVASYESGSRDISPERLFWLAEIYDASPVRVVAAIAAELQSASYPADWEHPVVVLPTEEELHRPS